MVLTDQPGRLAAVFIFAPSLVFAGLSLRRSDRYRRQIGAGVGLFGAVLLVYELFWITCTQPRECEL